MGKFVGVIPPVVTAFAADGTLNLKKTKASFTISATAVSIASSSLDTVGSVVPTAKKEAEQAAAKQLCSMWEEF